MSEEEEGGDSSDGPIDGKALVRTIVVLTRRRKRSW